MSGGISGRPLLSLRGVSKSLLSPTSPVPEGLVCDVRQRQVFWLANRPPGSLPDRMISDVAALCPRSQRRVRGGIA